MATWAADTILDRYNLYSREAYTSTCGSSILIAQLLIVEFIFRFGRRCVVLVGGLVSLICSLACAAAPNVTFFLIMRFLMATFSTGKTASIYVMGEFNAKSTHKT